MGNENSGRKHVCVNCDAAMKLYKEGFSLRAVGEQIGISRQMVRDILARHGVRRREPWARTQK